MLTKQHSIFLLAFVIVSIVITLLLKPAEYSDRLKAVIDPKAQCEDLITPEATELRTMEKNNIVDIIYEIKATVITIEDLMSKETDEEMLTHYRAVLVDATAVITTGDEVIAKYNELEAWVKDNCYSY